MIKQLSGLLAILTILGACQKNEVASLSEEATIHATIEDNDVTKTIMDESNNILWSENDQIIAFMKSSYGHKYQVKPSFVGKSYADFYVVSSGNGSDLSAGNAWDHNVVYYPFSENIECLKSGSNYALEVNLPSEQVYVPDSFANGSMAMVAVSENNNITFRNVLGGMKLQLRGTQKVKSISLQGKNNEKLSGAAVVTAYTDETKPAITMASGASTSVTLNCGSGVQLNESKATGFIISLPPVHFSQGFTVTVTDSDGKTYTVETDKLNEVIRSSLLVMPPVTLGASDEDEPEISSVDYIDEYGVNHGKGIRIGETVWAPVNCGYHATDFKYGKLYQWGRKYGQGYLLEYDATVPDEFLQGGAWDDETSANIFFYCPDAVMDDDEAEAYYWQYGKMQDDIRPIDWLDYPNDKLWNSGTLLDPVKTNSDPCPSGWRVPTDIELNDIKITLPKSGMRDDRGEADYRDQRGFYWSSTATSRYTPWWTVSDYMNDVALSNDGPSYRVYGYAVRCVQE